MRLSSYKPTNLKLVTCNIFSYLILILCIIYKILILIFCKKNLLKQNKYDNFTAPN